MSRNLCSTTCYFCGSTPALDEAPRPITRDDCGRYFDGRFGHRGMIVANATCVCGAEYLAYVDDRAVPWLSGFHRQASGEPPDTHFDLSFRSAFNDEPGESDYPKFPIVWSREEDRLVRYVPPPCASP